MAEKAIEWSAKHILKISNEVFCIDDLALEKIEWRKKIEPWLTAVFQSEHFSLLAGTGLTTAITALTGTMSPAMDRIDFEQFKDEIRAAADVAANLSGRGTANFEDDLRTALELLRGVQIKGEIEEASALEKEIDSEISNFIVSILKTEHDFVSSPEESNQGLTYLKSFLISFASRTATRDRLQIFTTNYDRFIEYGSEMVGIFTLDRFIGRMQPMFRASKLELDYHYNPPGIRGEPRYVEGVVRLTKLHGSIDWRFLDREIIKAPLPFGAKEGHPEIPAKAAAHAVIYPNSAKGVDTAFYPYSELFRDFACAVCRPNSAVITYGYGFGDSHINNILRDMLTIPSTHLVVISYDRNDSQLPRQRIQRFYDSNNPAQFTLLLGEHFGDLKTLVDQYLPKAAIDRLTEKMQQIKEKRGIAGLASEGPSVAADAGYYERSDFE